MLVLLVMAFGETQALSQEALKPRLSGLASLSMEIREIYDKAAPCVVVVEAPPPPTEGVRGKWEPSQDVAPAAEALPSEESVGPEQDPILPDTNQEETDTASGIVISSEGHVVTNYHVIQNVVGEFVKVKLRDKRVVKAKIVGSDAKTDIAVLVLSEKVPFLEKGDSNDAKVGDLVFALGAPYGLEYSMSMGIVGGRGRNPLTSSAYEDYIQTDAAINPGNSGGPLLNCAGRWVGMSTLINGVNRGLGFAIPSNQVMEVAGEIIKKGQVNRPWIGIRVAVRKNMEEVKGVEISWVAEGSPAEKAGFRKGDVLTSVNGQPIETPSDLQRKIWFAGIGGKLEMEIVRGKSSKTKNLVAIKMPENDFLQ